MRVGAAAAAAARRKEIAELPAHLLTAGPVNDPHPPRYGSAAGSESDEWERRCWRSFAMHKTTSLGCSHGKGNRPNFNAGFICVANKRSTQIGAWLQPKADILTSNVSVGSHFGVRKKKTLQT